MKKIILVVIILFIFSLIFILINENKNDKNSIVIGTQKNISECDLLPETDPVYKNEDDYRNKRDLCRISVATIKNDISLCESVVNQRMKKDCLGLLDKNFEQKICIYDNDTPWGRDGCLQTLAIDLGNPEICDLLQQKKARPVSYSDYSADSCYMSIATIKNDLGLCEKIIDNSKKEYCFNEVNRIKKTTIN